MQKKPKGYKSPLKIRLNNLSPQHICPSKRVDESKQVNLVPSFDIATIEHPRQTVSYFKNTYGAKIKAKESQSPYRSKQSQNGQSFTSDRLGKIKQLLTDISNQHQKMKETVSLLRQKENQEENQMGLCTFVPQIRRNPRYHISSTMQDRNKSWDDARVKHYTSIRQELVQNQVKQCTFNPNMPAFSHSKRILKKKELREHRSKEVQLDKGRDNNNNNNIPGMQFQQISQVQNFQFKEKKTEGIDLRRIKRLIKDQMTRIEFKY